MSRFNFDMVTKTLLSDIRVWLSFGWNMLYAGSHLLSKEGGVVTANW